MNKILLQKLSHVLHPGNDSAESSIYPEEYKITAFEALMNHINNGVYIFNTHLQIIDWNQRMAEISSIKKHEALGNNILDIYPYMRDTIEERMLYNTLSGSIIHLEARPFIHRTGYYEAIILPLFNEKNIIIGGINILTDVTALKKTEDDFLTINEELKRSNVKLRKYIRKIQGAEIALRQSEARFRLIAENATDFIACTDSEGCIIYISPAVHDILGLQTDKMTGQKMIDFIHPRDKEKYEHTFSSALSTLEIFTIELRMLCENNEYKWIETTMKAIYDTHHQVIEVQSASRDITSRKGSESDLIEKNKELQRSNNDLEQFAYVASHDLKEPLRMVSNYTQLLQHRYGDKLDDTAQEYIGFAVEGVHRMQELINDLLSYSRISHRNPDFRETDVNLILAEVLGNLQTMMDEKKAEIKIGHLPIVNGVPTQIYQLLQNLLENALKFHHDNSPPRIDISAHADGDFWHFMIADDGIGIDIQFSDKIFVIFQRLNDQGKYPGTGIGLAICKKIVELHGGHIWFENGQPGTIFHFTLHHYQAKKI